MITREEAKRLMYDIMNSGIISDEIEEKLQDVANCLEFEQYGLHMWGASDNDIETLTTSMRTDSPDYPAHIKKQQEIADYHRFTPSPFECDQEKGEEQEDE